MVYHVASRTAPVTSSIPQGSVLGLILFLIYVNDLPDFVSSKVKLFADDANCTEKFKIFKTKMFYKMI